MPDRTPAFLVNAYQEPVLVRVQNRACFQNSAPLRDFFERMIQEGKRRFVVDFRACSSMDSTFLGILAGLALRLREAEPPGDLRLCHLEARNEELVRNLGLHRILRVEEGADGPLDETQDELYADRRSEKENARLVLQAHQDLCEVDESNRNRFQDVIAFLKNQVDDA